MTYKYRGPQTIQSEEETQRQIAEMKVRERVAHRRAIQAEIVADRLREKNEQLKATVEQFRKDKKALQSRIVGLKKVRPLPKQEQGPGPIPEDLGGPAGLLAASQEVSRLARLRKERRQAQNQEAA